MTSSIPLAVLIEVNECLKLARVNAPASTYVRFLNAQTLIDFHLACLLSSQKVEVAV